MKTSKRTDAILLAIAAFFLVVDASGLLIWQAHRSQAHKPGKPDPTVEWWISGDKVTCKHPQNLHYTNFSR